MAVGKQEQAGVEGAPAVCGQKRLVKKRVCRLCSTDSIYVPCEVAGTLVTALIDTGSTISLIQMGLLAHSTPRLATDVKLEFQYLSATKDNQGTRTHVTKHGINTYEATPNRQQPWHLPLAQRAEVEEKIEEMAAAGVIHPSESACYKTSCLSTGQGTSMETQTACHAARAPAAPAVLVKEQRPGKKRGGGDKNHFTKLPPLLALLLP
ncbi:hypothetical protein SKAU_G00022070 [Synaphobranchus kaupii]|uniref:Peptidase A2 domain-containing protein n=1 Tax=Synaphobranchus kaupii TaxID=118154 RepID=A0A9Q1GDF1_SYNKA|nr:hypothetical protein SKAU_G00022070 [Synaphobranchus kaupii]